MSSTLRHDSQLLQNGVRDVQSLELLSGAAPRLGPTSPAEQIDGKFTIIKLEGAR